MNIFLIYGGKSAEHDVSIHSASSFVSGVNFALYSVTLIYITKEGTWMKGPVLTEPLSDSEKFQLDKSHGLPGESMNCMDIYDEESIVFPLMHGPNGEDGSVQGFLKVINMPFMGPDVVPCATGLDKIISKDLFSKAGLNQTPYLPVDRHAWKEDQSQVVSQIVTELKFPVYVKPANLGSSIGITEAGNEEELIEGIHLAFEYDRRVVVEQGVEAREVEIALLGNENVQASIVGEVIKEEGFFDYEDKYVNESFTEHYPADLSQQQSDQITRDAIKGFKALDGNGMARCDFFVTQSGEVFLNEINLIPGFYRDSVFSKLWQKSGMSYEEMIEEIIQLGLERAAVTQQLTKTDR